MKYNIDKGFGIFRYLKSPFNKFSFIFGNFLLSLIPKRFNTKYTVCSKFKLKNCNIYTIQQRNNKPTSTLMFYHGGGFCYKGSFNYYKYIKKYVRKLNILVVYVDYRLAYKYNYEVCVKDCFDAYNYILKNHKLLGVDPNNIGFIGDSAGGYISLSVIKLSYDKKMYLPKYQLLIYPVISNKRNFKSLSRFYDTPMWNSKLNEKMWNIYHYFNFDPLIDDITYMPKTYIELCEFDPLHDEGITLYNRMKSLNIDCYLNDTKKTIHGYDICLNHKISKESFIERIKFINNNK